MRYNQSKVAVKKATENLSRASHMKSHNDPGSSLDLLESALIPENF
jgi:hypothetical protein